MPAKRNRKLLFASLYFSEGAPIGFLWWTLPFYLSEAGVSVERVTALTSALALPWSLKFLLAPVIDLARGPRWSFRAWIVTLQAMMAATLAPLLFLDFHADFARIYPLLILHACAAAMQDAAVDGLAVRGTPPAELGAINGWMQGGMLTGRAVFSGGALLLGAMLGPTAVVAALIFAVLVSSSMLLTAGRDAEGESGGHAPPLSEFAAGVLRVLRGRSFPLALGFALTSGAGFEAVGALAPAWLVSRGLDEAAAGFFFSAVVILMVIGAFVGGRMADRCPGRAGVAAAVCGLALCILALAVSDRVSPGGAAAFVFLGGTYVMIGWFTAGSYALFMRLTDRRLGATMFSALMGATNMCEAWSGRLGGIIAERSGYPSAFAAAALLSLLSILFLPAMRPDIPSRTLMEE